jgi:hypothetical protein
MATGSTHIVDEGDIHFVKSRSQQVSQTRRKLQARCTIEWRIAYDHSVGLGIVSTVMYGTVVGLV